MVSVTGTVTETTLTLRTMNSPGTMMHHLSLQLARHSLIAFLAVVLGRMWSAHCTVFACLESHERTRNGNCPALNPGA